MGFHVERRWRVGSLCLSLKEKVSESPTEKSHEGVECHQSWKLVHAGLLREGRATASHHRHIR